MSESQDGKGTTRRKLLRPGPNTPEPEVAP